MRTMTKALVSVTAAAGIAAGVLVPAGTAAAAPAPQETQVQAEAAAQAVVNLGLNGERARYWQCFLRDGGYRPGTIDGYLGTDSWKAAQRMFKENGYYNDKIDGIVGPNTIAALQQMLQWMYGLKVDGIAGPKTKEAFWDYSGLLFTYCD